MPVITMTLGLNQATKEQKAEFIETITLKASEIISLPQHAFTILIHETSAVNIGVGGKTLQEMQADLK